MEHEKMIDKWSKEFKWLIFEDGKGFCEYCKLSNPLSAYSTGVTCLKKI